MLGETETETERGEVIVKFLREDRAQMTPAQSELAAQLGGV